MPASFAGETVIAPLFGQAPRLDINMTLSKRLASRFMMFAAVGAMATLIQYAILVLLMQTSPLSASLASGIGFVVSSVFNYALNRTFTFSSRASHRGALPRFIIVAGGGLFWNSIIMYVLADRLGVHYLLSQVITTGFVMMWNFLGNQFWTFKETLYEKHL